MSEDTIQNLNTNSTRIGIPTFTAKSIRSGQQLSEIIHKIGHDIGNPLTAIISIGSVIQTLSAFEGDPSQENKMPYYADSIVSEAWRISRINERLVCLFSERPVDPSPCEIKAILIQTLTRLKSREKKKYQPVDINISTTNPSPHALIDNNQLLLLISELISNAVESLERDILVNPPLAEFIPSIDVEITADETWVYLTVTSISSRPIPIELSECFKPLLSCYPEEKRIGLGLTTALAITERFNGKIELEEKKKNNDYLLCAKVSLPVAKQ